MNKISLLGEKNIDSEISKANFLSDQNNKFKIQSSSMPIGQ